MNDSIKATLATYGYTGSINDAYYRYLLAESGLSTSGHWHVNDLEKATLAGFGYTGSLNDMWSAFLTTSGYTGSLDDKKQAFWSDGLGFTPVAIPLTHTAVPTRGSITPSFTRATTATGQKWDEAGYLDFTALAGEAVFKGARRVRNLLTFTEDFSNAAWTKSVCSVTSSTESGPLGSTNATLITLGGGTTNKAIVYSATASAPAIPSFYFKAGTHKYIQLMNASDGEVFANFDLELGVVGTKGTKATSAIEDVGDGWYRVSALYNSTAILGTSWRVYFVSSASAVYAAATASTGTVYIWGAQLEDVTGQTTQTASEYVSVGALIHNSQDPNYLSLPGTAGHYASTPDSVAASITGDIDIRVKVNKADYSVATPQCLMSKLASSGTQLSYALTLSPGKLLDFLGSFNGTTFGVISTATAAATPVNGSDIWFRVNRTSAGSTTFYQSTDGTTWAQIGLPVADAGGALFNSTAAVEVGSIYTGAAYNFSGKIYSAQIYNTIGGTTPVVDFNPDRDATTPTGTITSSTTGEVWTINGASSVVRNAAYHSSMVDGVKCFDTDRSGNPISTSGSYPLVGYVPWEARTNLCIRSQEFDTWSIAAGGAGSVPVVTANQGVAPDGTTTADKVVFVAPGAGDVSQVYSPIFATVAASSYTAAVHVKAFAAGDVGKQLLIRHVGGTAYTTITLTAAWQRLGCTEVAVAATAEFDILLRPTFGGSSGTVSCYLWQADVQLGTFITPAIPTTTVAVARNADVLTYTGADVANIKTLATTSSIGYTSTSPHVIAGVSNNTTSVYSIHFIGSGNLDTAEGATGGNQWTIQGSARVANAVTKLASTWATNDVKADKNGTALTPDTTATVPAATQLDVGHLAGTLVLNGPVNHIYGWTRNLSQSELGAIDRA